MKADLLVDNERINTPRLISDHSRSRVVGVMRVCREPRRLRSEVTNSFVGRWSAFRRDVINISKATNKIRSRHSSKKMHKQLGAHFIGHVKVYRGSASTPIVQYKDELFECFAWGTRLISF
ncbi:hypothetical protein NPIL_392681 [Nephila pilipes]|uniref:Uncharacterized protein n=1 Tax=Nephila pilipes TaxID=299642 RepID=A0A8X6UJL9_NEPPI|nr:hypothetical protein NPIL_392681 [Nephila pilipes]